MDRWAAIALGLAVFSIYLSRKQLAIDTPTNPAAAAARRDLARRLGGAESDVEVLRVDPHTFPDTSLGLADPRHEMYYAQVLTPGWLVQLRAAGRIYEYHANEDGSRVALCSTCSDRLTTLQGAG